MSSQDLAAEIKELAFSLLKVKKVGIALKFRLPSAVKIIEVEDLNCSMKLLAIFHRNLKNLV